LVADGSTVDVLLFDLTDPDPTTSCAQDLYSEAAFSLAARCLGPGGVFVAQMQELSFLCWSEHRRHRQLLQKVFRHVFSYRVYVEFFGYWESFIIASNHPGTWSPLPADSESILQQCYAGPWDDGWSARWHEHLFTLPPQLDRRLRDG
jgi:spermidine synthase